MLIHILFLSLSVSLTVSLFSHTNAHARTHAHTAHEQTRGLVTQWESSSALLSPACCDTAHENNDMTPFRASAHTRTRANTPIILSSAKTFYIYNFPLIFGNEVKEKRTGGNTVLRQTFILPPSSRVVYLFGLLVRPNSPKVKEILICLICLLCDLKPDVRTVRYYVFSPLIEELQHADENICSPLLSTRCLSDFFTAVA